MIEVDNHKNMSKKEQDRLFGDLNKLAPDRLSRDRGTDIIIPPDCRPIVAEIAAYFQKFVISQAIKNKEHAPIDDLVQAGNEGLLKAVWMFDTEKGVKFITYAGWWVRKGISEEIGRQRMVRLPAHVKETIRKVAKIATQSDTPLSNDEIADRSGLKVQTVLKYKKYLDYAIMPLDDYSLIGYKDQEDDLMKDDLARTIEDVFLTLPPKVASVLTARYGLNGFGGVSQTQAEIAERLGVSKQRVQQIEDEAIKALRENEELRFYCGVERPDLGRKTGPIKY